MDRLDVVLEDHKSKLNSLTERMTTVEKKGGTSAEMTTIMPTLRC